MKNYLKAKIAKFHGFINRYNGNGFFCDLCDVVFTYFYSDSGFFCEWHHFKGRYL